MFSMYIRYYDKLNFRGIFVEFGCFGVFFENRIGWMINKKFFNDRMFWIYRSKVNVLVFILELRLKEYFGY